MFVYLDNSATTKPSKEVIEAIKLTLETEFGNPSSLYRLGLSAEKILKKSRENVAKSIGADSDEVFFTSCGTESDNAVLKGVWEARKKEGKRVITTAVEHPAILNSARWLETQGADVVYLPVDKAGFVSLEDFKKALTTDTILVSVMHVNNESGAIMPIAEIRKIMTESGSKAFLHSDAVQSYGKLNIDVKSMGVDFLSISGHKVHAPKGIGVLYIKKGTHLPSFIHGGGQEKGYRSGTENMPGIAAMGAAAEAILKNPGRGAEIAGVRDYLRSRIEGEIKDIRINTPSEGCVQSLLNVSFIGCRGEVLLHTLEQSEIYVSTGSACSSHSKGSHVLTAMGLSPEEIEGAVRFSFCEDNTKEQMDYVMEKLLSAVESQRKLIAAFHRR